MFDRFIFYGIIKNVETKTVATDTVTKDGKNPTLSEPSLLQTAYFLFESICISMYRLKNRKQAAQPVKIKILSPASVNHYLRHIRAFLYWCMEQGFPCAFRKK